MTLRQSPPGTDPARARAIRARLGYPIVDADGHTLELLPVFEDFLREVGGGDIVERFHRSPIRHGGAVRIASGWHAQSPEERRDTWTRVPPWWTVPTRTLDRATAILPQGRTNRTSARAGSSRTASCLPRTRAWVD